MAQSIRLAVVGATGTLGRQLIGAIEELAKSSSVELESLVPIAPQSSSTTHVEVLGREVPVQTPEEMEWSAADVVFVAAPPAFDRTSMQACLDAGGIVIDCTSTDSSKGPLVAPWCNESDLDAVLDHGFIRSPRPLSLALTAIVKPLHIALGVEGVRGVAMVPACFAGRAGIEELSGQVVSLFNSQSPPRSVFPDGLAFDLLPAWGDEDATGWTGEEARAAEEMAELVGLDSSACSLSVVGAPLFVGMGLSLHIVTHGHDGREGIRSLLEGAPKISLHQDVRRALMPRSRLDLATVGVGRIREDRGGAGVHLWAACDPTELAARNAVELLVQVVENGIL